MRMAPTEIGGVKEILERKEAELVQVLRKLDGIAIEKSPDRMDEIQYASERDLANRNVGRESNLLRQVEPHCDGFTTATLEPALSANG